MLLTFVNSYTLRCVTYKILRTGSRFCVIRVKEDLPTALSAGGFKHFLPAGIISVAKRFFCFFGK